MLMKIVTAPQGEVICMALRKILDNVYVIPGSPKTIIAQLEESTWIVDPGMGVDRDYVIKKSLKEVGNAKEIKVLLSHTHYDHIEALKGIKEYKVHVSVLEVGTLLDPTFRERSTYGYNLLPRILGLEKLSLYDLAISPILLNTEDLDNELHVLKLPGHSPGHIGVSYEDILFVGDSVFGDKLLKRVGIPYHINFVEAMKSLECVLDYAHEYNTIVLSHGPIVSRKRAEELILYNMSTMERIKELVINLIDNLNEFSIDNIVYRVLKELSTEISPESIILGTPLVVSILNDLSAERSVEVRSNGETIIWRIHEE